MAPELGKGSWECLCEMGLEQALKEVGHSLQALGWVGGIWNLAPGWELFQTMPLLSLCALRMAWKSWSPK